MKAIAAAAILTGAYSIMGCVTAIDGEASAYNLDSAASQTQTVNGMKPEYVRNARLLTDARLRDQLLGNPLSTSDLSPEIRSALRVDSNADTLMAYIVRCALPTDAELVAPSAQANGAEIRYPGQIGLAAGWAKGPADDEMRQWVSACVIAHTNYDAVHTKINLVGADSLGQGSSYDGFPVEEGTYWGDIFAADSEQKRFACSINAPEMSRVCKGDSTYCGDYLHGSGSNKAIEPCTTTCITKGDDEGKVHSSYFSDCKIGAEASSRTITVYRDQ